MWNYIFLWFYWCPDCLKVLIVLACHFWYCVHCFDCLLVWNYICLWFYWCLDCLKVLWYWRVIFGTVFTVLNPPWCKWYLFVILLVSWLSQGIDSICVSFLPQPLLSCLSFDYTSVFHFTSVLTVFCYGNEYLPVILLLYSLSWLSFSINSFFFHYVQHLFIVMTVFCRGQQQNRCSRCICTRECLTMGALHLS